MEEEITSASRLVELNEHNSDNKMKDTVDLKNNELNEDNVENEKDETRKVEDKVEDPCVGMLFGSIDNIMDILHGECKQEKLVCGSNEPISAGIPTDSTSCGDDLAISKETKNILDPVVEERKKKKKTKIATKVENVSCTTPTMGLRVLGVQKSFNLNESELQQSQQIGKESYEQSIMWPNINCPPNIIRMSPYYGLPNMLQVGNSPFQSSMIRQVDDSPLQKACYDLSNEHPSNSIGSLNALKEQKRNTVPPIKKRKSLNQESDENGSLSAITRGKGKLKTHSDESAILGAQLAEPKSGIQQSAHVVSWSQKSSWRALVGDKSNTSFSVSHILPGIASSKEHQPKFDGSSVPDSTISKNDNLVRHGDHLESHSSETIKEVTETQPTKPSAASSNSGRGAAWLEKSS
nr:hypothetical protein CFP56_14638 [Quercus suber]